jgi:hypothetical protein
VTFKMCHSENWTPFFRLGFANEFIYINCFLFFYVFDNVWKLYWIFVGRPQLSGPGIADSLIPSKPHRRTRLSFGFFIIFFFKYYINFFCVLKLVVKWMPCSRDLGSFCVFWFQALGFNESFIINAFNSGWIPRSGVEQKCSGLFRIGW